MITFSVPTNVDDQGIDISPHPTASMETFSYLLITQNKELKWVMRIHSSSGKMIKPSLKVKWGENGESFSYFSSQFPTQVVLIFGILSTFLTCDCSFLWLKSCFFVFFFYKTNKNTITNIHTCIKKWLHLCKLIHKSP